MKSRCKYCGSVIDKSKNYCNSQCLDAFIAFEKRTTKMLPTFGILIGISFIISFIGMIITMINITLGKFVLFIGTLALFITLFIFPFATPETVNLIGIKKSIILVRFLIIFFLLPLMLFIL